MSPPTSVLLPTVEWTPACEAVAEGLGPEDELLVLCDRPTDPVASHAPPGVEVCVAGEPEGCAGKANALAHGIERARHDRLVWTDADFDRGPDWLDRLVEAGERHGPATAIPFFHGGGLWAVLEPWYVLVLTLPFYLGLADDWVWGGGVTFTRSEVDVDALATDLRRVISDDGLLGRRLDAAHAVRSMVTPVAVPGDPRSVWHRHVRFARIAHLYYGATGGGVAVVAAVLGLAALAPLVAVGLVTAVAGLAYALVGIRRPTFLLAPLGIVVLPLLLPTVLRTEFAWAGRRYRVDGPFDVTVLGPAESEDQI